MPVGRGCTGVRRSDHQIRATGPGTILKITARRLIASTAVFDLGLSVTGPCAIGRVTHTGERDGPTTYCRSDPQKISRVHPAGKRTGHRPVRIGAGC